MINTLKAVDVTSSGSHMIGEERNRETMNLSL